MYFTYISLNIHHIDKMFQIKVIDINEKNILCCVHHFFYWRWDSSVGIVTKLQAGNKESGFISWQRQEVFLFSMVSRPVVGPTQPPPMGTGWPFLWG
jgi:hypothetical protein